MDSLTRIAYFFLQSVLNFNGLILKLKRCIALHPLQKDLQVLACQHKTSLPTHMNSSLSFMHGFWCYNHSSKRERETRPWTVANWWVANQRKTHACQHNIIQPYGWVPFSYLASNMGLHCLTFMGRNLDDKIWERYLVPFFMLLIISTQQNLCWTNISMKKPCAKTGLRTGAPLLQLWLLQMHVCWFLNWVHGSSRSSSILSVEQYYFLMT